MTAPMAAVPRAARRRAGPHPDGPPGHARRDRRVPCSSWPARPPATSPATCWSPTAATCSPERLDRARAPLPRRHRRPRHGCGRRLELSRAARGHVGADPPSRRGRVPRRLRSRPRPSHDHLLLGRGARTSSSSRRCPGRCGSATSTPTSTTSDSGATTWPADGAGLAGSGCPLQLCGRAGDEAPVAFAYHRNDLGVRIEIVDSRHARGHGVPVPTRRGAERDRPVLQVRVHGPGDVRVDEVAEPDPAPATSSSGWRPAASAAATSPTSRWVGWPGPTGTPMCLGHEMAGVVDWVGPEVTTAARRRPGGRPTGQTTSSAGSATAPPKGSHAAPAGHRGRPRPAPPRPR